MPSVPSHYSRGPEALVVSLAVTGDRQAFAELVSRRQVWLRSLMWRFCGDGSLADDLSQQTFMQAWRKIRTLRHPERFGAWLRKLAVNEWLQHQRKGDALRNADTDEHLEVSGSDKTAMAMDLDRAIATLPGPVSLCIVLSYHERLSHPEIAELTGIQLGTVKSHIRRGSERLREALSAYDEPDSPEDPA